MGDFWIQKKKRIALPCQPILGNVSLSYFSFRIQNIRNVNMGELLTPERLALLVSVAALATISIASVLTILFCTRWSLLYLSTLLHVSRIHLLSFLNNLYLQERLEKECDWRIYNRSHSHVKNIRNHLDWLRCQPIFNLHIYMPSGIFVSL